MLAEEVLKRAIRNRRKSNNVMISDHIKLGSDTWTVYKIEGNKLYLSLSTLYGKGTKHIDLT